MAEKDLKSIKFPGLDDTYSIPDLSEDIRTLQTALAAETTAREAGDAANAAAVEAEASARAAADEAIREVAYGAYPTGTASGAIATFSDGADGIPVESLTVVIEPVQAGSGDPSPDNVRPITGWTGASVTRTGKNLVSASLTTKASSGITFTVNADKSITVNGKATALSVFSLFDNNSILNLLPGVTYHIGFTGGDGELLLQVYVNGIFIGQTSGPKISITIPNDATYSFARLRAGTGDAYNNLTVYPVISVNDDISWEPPVQDTYAITLPSEAGTVYGGTLDLTTGTLTSRPYYASYAGETLVGPWISSMDVYTSGATPTTGAQVVDVGGDPITYQLTPQEVTTLLGANNIWADTGDVDVTYRADTKLYIDKKIAELQALILEQ